MDYSRLICLIAKEIKIVWQLFGVFFLKSNLSSGYLTVMKRLKNSQHVSQVTRHKTMFRWCIVVKIKWWTLLWRCKYINWPMKVVMSTEYETCLRMRKNDHYKPVTDKHFVLQLGWHWWHHLFLCWVYKDAKRALWATVAQGVTASHIWPNDLFPSPDL